MGNGIDLNRRRALITGAGEGAGRAIALRLAGEGMKLALAGRDAASLMRTAALTGRPLDMLVLPADITTPRGIGDIMHIMEGHFKGLDALVNCEETRLDGPFEGLGEEDFDRVMALNARAPFALCRRSLKLLRLSDAPIILNLGAGAGDPAQGTLYAASKGALAGLTRALAEEVAPEGIRVCLLEREGGDEAVAERACALIARGED